MSDNIKKELDTLWIKYQKTLEMLDQTLDELDKKPKEVEIPITEYVEVPKIVEVEVVKDIAQETKDAYERQIADLQAQLNTKNLPQPGTDYWRRPKNPNPSKKLISDEAAESLASQKYQKIVNLVREGMLDINTLTVAEQEIVKKLLDE